MPRMLTSIVLCVLAQTAAAQCVDSTTHAAAQVGSGGELIKTAAAAGQDAPPMRRVSATSSPAAVSGHAEEERRGTGPAMLLAAVALMSGIALRRAGASGQ